MANLTSRIAIVGNVGGRGINFTHTYTVEDVYDAALRTSSKAFNYDSLVGTDNVVPFQDTPNYLLLSNTHPQFPVVFGMATSGNTMKVVCQPNSFAILHATTALGILDTSNGTTALLDVSNVSGNALQGLSNGQASVLAAFNAST